MVSKMNREERAKQFMPFGALKGYPEALARRERKPLPRRELSEERLEELNRQLMRLMPGDRVKISYYFHGEYQMFFGEFLGADAVTGKIRIGENVIPIDNIYDLRVVPEESSL